MLRPRRGPFPVPGCRTSSFLPWDRGSLKGVSKLIIQVGGRDEEPWAVSSHPCSRLEPPSEKCCDITLVRTSVDFEFRRSGRGVMKNRLGSRDATTPCSLQPTSSPSYRKHVRSLSARSYHTMEVNAGESNREWNRSSAAEGHRMPEGFL